MAEVSLGIGASHSTLMNTHWHLVAESADANRFREALDGARDELAKAKPDALVVIGSNHFRGFFLDLMPAFTIGVGRCFAAGESGTPAGEVPVHTELARHISDSLVESGFDAAFSLKLNIDHGLSHSLQYLTPDLDIPIVPVVINMFAPPLPTMRRSYDFGEAIGAAIRAFPQDMRIGVVASGGLSHRLPWPKWFEALSDDDRFLVEAWLNGREQWKDYEQRRRQIILKSEADINADFDLEFLGNFESNALDQYINMGTDELDRIAGNGAQELRSWLAMAGAVGPGQGETLAYAPMDEWLTGMGIALYRPVA
jgi:2,3-dihydroxyphenylpropionate 1,2-dioxygenase